MGRPEGKTPLERPSNKWEDYIKMDLKISWMGRRGMS